MLKCSVCEKDAVIQYPAENSRTGEVYEIAFCVDHDEQYGPIDDELQFGELPPGVCPACMGLSPGIAIDGQTIMHCPVCHDTGKVTPEEAERHWKAIEEREKRREQNG